MREKYEVWFRGFYKQEPMPELGAPAHDFCWAGYLAGAASRDAEVAELKEDATDFHGQINRLTEWNNNLVSHRDELKSELFDLTKQRDALSRIADTLEQERDQLREQVTLLRDAILNRMSSENHWPEYIIEALADTEPK